MFQKSILVLILAVQVQSIFAIDSDFTQPIYFQAENSIFNYNKNTVTASGSVQISQGSILIQASNATGSLRNGQPYQITLTGNPVKFQQRLNQGNGMVYGKANSISYSSTSSEIVLKGKASIIQDNGSSLSGETLRYNLTMGDIEAKGSPNRRVQIIIPPQKNTKIKPLDITPEKTSNW